MSEIVGYNGPIYMTYPTASIAPLLLEDMRKVMVERKNETNFFTSSDIKNCMKKVIACDLHEVIQVAPDIQVGLCVNDRIDQGLLCRSCSWGRHVSHQSI